MTEKKVIRFFEIGFKALIGICICLLIADIGLFLYHYTPI